MRALPSYEEALALPSGPRLRVPAERVDTNGHLNVRHYLGTFDDAEWTLFEDLGLAADGAGGGNVFALEQYLTYRREVLVGAEVSVHLRVVGRDERMLHLVTYLLDHGERRVAASLEGLEAYVDHGTRRMAAFPDDVAAALNRWASEHAALAWSPELSGAMGLRGAR
ncbi:thioesterase family protein [Nocardioides marmoraquaticus]